MQKVHISTYCTQSSYGSILQSLGLKAALSEIGWESTIVKCGKKPDRQYRLRCGGFGFGQILRWLSKVPVYPKVKQKYESTCAFMETHLDVAYFDDPKAMETGLADERVFLAGSDQIWNPINLRKEFFLDFASEGAKRISYAASMGVQSVPTENVDAFARMINKFDYVSVREQECAEVVAEYTTKDVAVHIDPTFLRTKDWWASLEKAYPMEGPYILVYPLYWDASFNQQLKDLHRRSGKNIVVIADYPRNIYGNKWVFDADPGQFLWLIHHADAVITSSFHGVAMSLNYNVPVIPVINPSAPARINHLLRVLNCPTLTIGSFAEGDTILFDQINQRIEEERHRGCSYLKEVMQSNV